MWFFFFSWRCDALCKYHWFHHSHIKSKQHAAKWVSSQSSLSAILTAPPSSSDPASRQICSPLLNSLPPGPPDSRSGGMNWPYFWKALKLYLQLTDLFEPQVCSLLAFRVFFFMIWRISLVGLHGGWNPNMTLGFLEEVRSGLWHPFVHTNPIGNCCLTLH